LLTPNIQCVVVNPATGEVMIATEGGLCSYMGDATEAEEQLDYGNTIAYPNPVGPDYQGVVTIDGLTHNTEVKICSSTGQLINSGRSNGGRFTWNLKTKQGRRVSSGVYNVIANTEDGKKAIVTRIVVIK
ncbi:MAG: T9SS type A sorting domain-containing protein, partial [Bacteroidaceae bacterium]|nr:T9SS type A sorting domain-containing protein [Bacteroidaceae bacterium]